MPTCAECGKKVGIFNSQGWHYFCNDECKSKFQEKKKRGMIKTNITDKKKPKYKNFKEYVDFIKTDVVENKKPNNKKL